MKYILHFIKSNYKYNKLEIGFSYGIGLLILGGFFYFQDHPNVDSDMLFSLGFYAGLYAFLSNRFKLNVKYLLSLPISKTELICAKVFGDLVYFVPAFALIFTGVAFDDKLPLTLFGTSIFLLLLSVQASLMLFNSDIEQPRLENTKSSFINKAVYFKKTFDIFTTLILLGIMLAITFSLDAPAYFKEYLFLVMGIVSTGFQFRKSLRLLKDESLSYFIFRRDAPKLLYKVAAFGVPFFLIGLIIPKHKYGKHDVYKHIVNNNLEKVQAQSFEDYDQMVSKTISPEKAAIKENRFEIFKVIFDKSKDDEKLKHNLEYSVAYGSPMFVEYLLKQNEETIQQQDLLNQAIDESQNTLLLASIKRCDAYIIDLLIQYGADVQKANKDGDSPLIAATKNKWCFTGASLLLENGADVDWKNKKGLSALDYARYDNVKYIYSKYTKSSGKRRSIASQINTTGKASSSKLLKPMQLLLQK